MKGAPVVNNPSLLFELEAVLEMLHAMREQQTGFRLTGGMHAAGLYARDGTSLVVMEDIGRHNAVDKAYGAWYGQTPNGRTFSCSRAGAAGTLSQSSRHGYAHHCEFWSRFEFGRGDGEGIQHDTHHVRERGQSCHHWAH